MPQLPPEWRYGIDMHEKWMQMAFRAQLERLGDFAGRGWKL